VPFVKKSIVHSVAIYMKHSSHQSVSNLAEFCCSICESRWIRITNLKSVAKSFNPRSDWDHMESNLNENSPQKRIMTTQS